MGKSADVTLERSNIDNMLAASIKLIRIIFQIIGPMMGDMMVSIMDMMKWGNGRQWRTWSKWPGQPLKTRQNNTKKTSIPKPNTIIKETNQLN